MRLSDGAISAGSRPRQLARTCWSSWATCSSVCRAAGGPVRGRMLGKVAQDRGHRAGGGVVLQSLYTAVLVLAFAGVAVVALVVAYRIYQGPR